MSTTGGYRPFSTSKHLPDKSHLFLVAFRFCKFFILYKTNKEQLNNILLH